ncbi:hypothetical protein HYH03_007740 [Edaphochlamys debaryana]|uniref:Uncharacterized protein n=1 Tax=Edaphochlamys debaryana TaxID=47281 RepID=A0A835Y1B7_9CHLO|nr:hypothetical protein HYH03_007740 [Edaphochlamys debaryana]|eukprot:KAG2494101.1 hypothetical protein HYH03_007740 [Edaphochlamys debaryana]
MSLASSPTGGPDPSCGSGWAPGLAPLQPLPLPLQLASEGGRDGGADPQALVPAAPAGALRPAQLPLPLARAPASWALAELEAPPPTPEQVLARRDALAAARAAAEAHHHRDVWVKEPHGGPYRKAVSRSAPGAAASPAGPLAAWSPPAALRGCGPGYEAVRVGPTSNFVGDAMSSGAVDLVRAELEQLRLCGPHQALPAPPLHLHPHARDAQPPASLGAPLATTAGAAAGRLPPPPPPSPSACGHVGSGGAGRGEAEAAPVGRAVGMQTALPMPLQAPPPMDWGEVRRAARQMLGRVSS